MIKAAVLLLCCTLLSSCGTPSITPSPNHIKDTPRPAGNIPGLVQQSPALRAPKAAPKVETYSVAVSNVPVQSLLFALARDAKLNVDIHPSIEGNVTLNALDQTLPQLLNRIAKQIDMRYELDGPNLAVLPDAPFLRNYKVDYVNIARNTTSNVNIATQISSTGGSAAGGAGNNNSTTSVSNTSNNHFWETLVQNIKDTLRETDKILPDSADSGTEPATGNQPATAGQTAATGANSTARRSTFREAASVIVNAETGLIAVRATSRQHEKIQEFLDMVLSSAKRQVLIEATIIEVQLNDQYQQGINWSRLRTGSAGFNATQGQTGATTLPSGVAPGSTPGIFVLNYVNPASVIGNIAATIQLLESFGKVKVLSSPKISVLNNQTAMLKVVDNRVYFTITATTTAATATSAATSTYSTELHTVPVGFVMSVTPQIADSDEVTLNVRPSISRIISFVQDPNPALANALVPVVSNVPVIQTREMESILKISSGQVAVMGGLMQDTVNNLKDSIPGVSKVPILGDALGYRNESTTKTELVIFLRPMVVKDASLNGDYKDYRYFLPNENAFNDPYGASGSPGSEPVKTGTGQP
jgi:general secretion pathway protein D